MTDAITNFREAIALGLAPTIEKRLNILEREANTDPLTGLANRTAFEKALPKAKRNMAFILFDLNNFGKVNKTAGHARGDELLKYYADVLANVASKFKARAFRLGGDEFVIICSHQLSFQIRAAAEFRALPIKFENFTVSLSGEVGYSVEDADSRLQRRKAERKSQE